MKSLLSRFRKDEAGVTAIEYGLIAALIAVVIITAVTLLAPGLERGVHSHFDCARGRSLSL